MKLEHKQFKGEIKQMDGDGSFEAVIATLNVVDSDGDIIVAGAFDGATVSVLPAHDSRHIPLGKAQMEDRGNFAVAVGKLNLDIQSAKEWSSALKFDLENGKAVQEWSFAYRVVESDMETRDGEQVRILKKMDVMEVSPVLRGAGVGTGTIAAKQRFADQLDTTLKAVEDTLERAKSIAELRASKDKPATISDVHKTTIESLNEKLAQILSAFSPSEEKDGPEMAALAESLHSDSTRLGVDIKD